MALLTNYNRARLGNTAGSSPSAITTTESTLLELGINIPTGTNFVQFDSTIGWTGTPGTPAGQLDYPDVEFRIYDITAGLPGTLIASTRQNSSVVRNAAGNVSYISDNTTTFQAILTVPTDVTTGFHAYDLRVVQIAGGPGAAQGTAAVSGPVNISISAIDV